MAKKRAKTKPRGTGDGGVVPDVLKCPAKDCNFTGKNYHALKVHIGMAHESDSVLGRPSYRTEAIDQRIDEAAAFGATIEEIAFYCGIHRETLYRWMREDKALNDRIEELREKPILLARQTVVNGINKHFDNAMTFLERKRKGEFSKRSELTGADGKDLGLTSILDEIENPMDEVRAKKPAKAKK